MDAFSVRTTSEARTKGGGPSFPIQTMRYVPACAVLNGGELRYRSAKRSMSLIRNRQLSRFRSQTKTGALSSTSRLEILRATSNRYVGGALISMTLFALPESQVQALIEQTPAEPVRAAESQLDGATIPGKVAETAALTPASSATYPAGQGGKSGAIGSERLGYAGSAPASRQD